MMRFLNNKNDVENLSNAVKNCQEKVVLRSADGSEEYNLKSVLSFFLTLKFAFNIGKSAYLDTNIICEMP